MAAAVGIAAQSFVVPEWFPAATNIPGAGWPIDGSIAVLALGGGLWLRSLILGPGDGASMAATLESESISRTQRASRLVALARGLADLRSVRTPAQIADALARHAIELTAADGAVVYVPQSASGDLIALGRSGRPQASLPERLADVDSGEAPPDGIVDLPIVRGSHRLAVLRIAIPPGGRSDGLVIADAEPMATRPGLELEVLIQLAADALERLRLVAAGRRAEEEAAGAVGRLAILSRLAAALVGGTTVQQAARTLVDLAIDDLGAGFAVVHVPDHATGAFQLVHVRGYPAGLVAGEQTIPPGAASPVTKAASDGAPLEIVGDDGWRAAFPTASNVPAITGVGTITAIPMRASGIVQGVLTIGWRTATDRGRPDLDLLSTAADQGAQALERALLHAHDEDARRFQEAFIGVVSHELRTPITTIVAAARLLHRRLKLDPGSADLSEDIEIEADRLSRIVDDLLVLSRLERRHLSVGDEPVHLGHLMTRIVRSESSRWSEHRFVAPKTSGRQVVIGDETYVEQILRNLISNAAKYSAAGSTVEIVVDDSDDGEVLVRVLDEGPGVAPSEIEDLFSLFYRSPTTAANAAGAGIGLFVSRRLVAEMGGRMWARPRPTRGSEFGFSLERFPIEDVEPDDDEVGRVPAASDGAGMSAPAAARPDRSG